jgi:hypothetical protein
MTAAIAVQSAKNTLAFDHFLQPSHHRQRGFFLAQLRVVDLAGGIIQDHDQVIPAFVLEPLVPAPVDVQQHPWQGTPPPALAMCAALALTCDQPRPLQDRLHPGVTQSDRMLLA